MKKRTTLGVAAATLVVASQIGSVAPTAEAAASPHQARQIQKMVEANQIDDLVAYIATNPSVTTGDGPLAQLLRDFMRAVQTGALFAFDAAATQGVGEAISLAAENAVFGGDTFALY